MEQRSHGELSTRRTISQMQSHWRSRTSLHSLGTGKHNKRRRWKMCDCIHARTHTHLTLQQFLQYCKTQVNYINHSCTDSRLHLKLFCLSAPSQLLHADPYYTLAASWGGGGPEVRTGRRKVMKEGKGQQAALKEEEARWWESRKIGTTGEEGDVSNPHCRTMGNLQFMKLICHLNNNNSSNFLSFYFFSISSSVVSVCLSVSWCLLLSGLPPLSAMGLCSLWTHFTLRD